MRVMATLLGLALALATAACPPDDKKAPAGAANPAVCTKVGQSCEFSPGKLGTCVTKDGCQGEGCFVCQSQH
jgi:hypothetical protein